MTDVGIRAATTADVPALLDMVGADSFLDAVYGGGSLALLTDLCQLTMVLGVHRLWHGDTLAADLIYDAERGATAPLQLGDLDDLGRGVPAPAHDRTEELLVRMIDRRVGGAA